MAQRHFHHLEILESAFPDLSLPSQLLPGDALGGRTFHPEDDPPVVLLGRLGLYLARTPSWTAIPYASIVVADHTGDPGLGPVRLQLVLSSGATEEFVTSELSGLLGQIHRRAKNLRWDAAPLTEP